ncbi:hypothetical protein EUTSA_v10000426mg [Eutrema salsugineum]|uniref:BHLH domain-containing protein n=2 Tax=Eutrema salsugineum TaxID=72664 RepID=V4NIV1_EUTSA|nr:hypothetical protein EUTSA_v10000426mg [Eutrema salsugineum]
MNSLVGDVPQSLSSLDDITSCYNFDSSCNDDLIEKKPAKIVKTTHISPKLHHFPSSNPLPPKLQPSSRILSFEKMGFKNMNQNSPNLIFSAKEEAGSPELITRETKRAQPLTRSPSNSQDHILAERKRREKLSQRFVALSALIPGLKKMDKASVLGDAIKHIKNLQESVKEFEEQKKERTMESMVLVKKSQFVLNDYDQPPSSSSDGNHEFSSLNLPEMEVRVSGKEVLIKMLCDKQKGHVIKIMDEIEKLDLSITNSIVLPFGPTFDITIIAQKNNDFDMKIEDVTKSLSCGLSKFM